MRKVGVSDAEAHLLSLLDDVERGETLVITRHGRPIARIVPEVEGRREKIDSVLAEIETFRKTMPRIAISDLLSARHEGHRY